MSDHSFIPTGPILEVETLPPSVITSPNNQFNVTCNARAVIDGQGFPLVIEWTRIISTSPNGSINVSELNSTEYNVTTTGSPEGGYQSVLTTTENDTVNMIIYRCTARPLNGPTTEQTNDTTVYIEGTTKCY